MSDAPKLPEGIDIGEWDGKLLIRGARAAVPWPVVLHFAARHAPAALIRAAAEVLRGNGHRDDLLACGLDVEAARLEAEGKR